MRGLCVEFWAVSLGGDFVLESDQQYSDQQNIFSFCFKKLYGPVKFFRQ